MSVVILINVQNKCWKLPGFNLKDFRIQVFEPHKEHRNIRLHIEKYNFYWQVRKETQ